ncbi:hypothetical protein F5Y12DRAFT_636007 [Xylaria sp. FL1777]|nr:hypothetical protein F5Y12DRAFT_636007 [Xylaria sp. FL1777]
MVTCKIFSRRFPIGVLTGREITKSRLGTCSSHDAESDWQLTATLFPLPWLANWIIKVAVGYSFAEGYNFRYRRYQYNPEPRLIECLNTDNLEGLQRMFTDGKAGVHDLAAPWGNSLLHEAVLRHATGIPNMLDICNFLLVHGIDPNLQNSNGRCDIAFSKWQNVKLTRPHGTALIQCCQLTKKSELLNKALIPLASCMIERGADLSLTNREGYSVCALLFESPQGFSYIDEYVYQHIDLCTYEDLRSTDFWLVAALARCIPPFKRRLEAQLEAFRTPKTISSSARPLQDRITGVTVDEQVEWIRAASQKDRTVFMRTMCAHGSLSMVEPFLTCVWKRNFLFKLLFDL